MFQSVDACYSQRDNEHITVIVNKLVHGRLFLIETTWSLCIMQAVKPTGHDWSSKVGATQTNAVFTRGNCKSFY